ncbi:MAG: succinylglutamate desuccinylase/aspartoacylase family protein [Verrucomicrobiota bacterium]
MKPIFASLIIFQQLLTLVIAESGKIAEDTAWETEYHVVDSGVDGPNVLIVGGMHGDEPSGWRAAEQIRHWPIVKGKMIVIPRANVLGLQANTRYVPNQPEAERDLNRNFPQTKADSNFKANPRGELAAALWQFATKAKPDWVIDLHEGYEFNISHEPPEGKKKSVGSSVIYRQSEELDALARKIQAAANETVTDPKKRFSLLGRGPVSTGLARACINVIGAEAMILETTFKDQPISLRTRQHRAMANVILQHIGVLDRDCRKLIAGKKSNDHLQVAIFDGVGTGASKVNLAAIVDADKNMTLNHVGAEEIQLDVLNQFDVIIFPGGSGSKQGGDIGENGRKAVREFTERGGGVVGVCAGAYLCSAHYSWSLDLIDSAVFTGAPEIPGKGKKQMWYRGKEATIDMELTDSGESLFGNFGINREFVVRYCNGPIISPKKLDELDDYRVLAWFRSENGLWEPQKGTMINTPAIVSGTFGRGRIMSVSPHPEKTPALHPIIAESIRWVASQTE